MSPPHRTTGAHPQQQWCPWCEKKMDAVRRIACDFCGTEVCFDCIRVSPRGELYCESCKQELERRLTAKLPRRIPR